MAKLNLQDLANALTKNDNFNDSNSTLATKTDIVTKINASRSYFKGDTGPKGDKGAKGDQLEKSNIQSRNNFENTRKEEIITKGNNLLLKLIDSAKLLDIGLGIETKKKFTTIKE